MSFLRHGEIYRPMSLSTGVPGRPCYDRPASHRFDEFPAGYSLASCAPAEPASASPAGAHLAANGIGGTIKTQRTANCLLTPCLTQGDNPSCLYLFIRTKPAWKKALEWSRREEEYVKRAGFSLMAYLAIHDKQAKDAKFARLLPVIRRHADDDRNFVKKAVNWALRQIGKRNLRLNHQAVRTAKQIQLMDSRSARWIAADALRELTGLAVQRRLRRKALTHRS